MEIARAASAPIPQQPDELVDRLRSVLAERGAVRWSRAWRPRHPGQRSASRIPQQMIINVPPSTPSRGLDRRRTRRPAAPGSRRPVHRCGGTGRRTAAFDGPGAGVPLPQPGAVVPVAALGAAFAILCAADLIDPAPTSTRSPSRPPSPATRPVRHRALSAVVPGVAVDSVVVPHTAAPSTPGALRYARPRHSAPRPTPPLTSAAAEAEAVRRTSTARRALAGRPRHPVAKCRDSGEPRRRRELPLAFDGRIATRRLVRGSTKWS
jgi:hypothetical protein